MATLPSEKNLYHVLERVLKTKTEPQTCVTLFDEPAIRKLADSVNAVSDALGNLWRRGYLYREPAPKTTRSQAKWAYLWKEPEKRKVMHPAELQAMSARAFDAQPREEAPPTHVGQLLMSKPSIRITDYGGSVVIDLPQLQVTIKTTNGPGG